MGFLDSLLTGPALSAVDNSTGVTGNAGTIIPGLKGFLDPSELEFGESSPGIEALLQQLKGKATTAAAPKGNPAADIGSLLGKFSAGEQNERYGRANLTQAYDQLMQQAQTGRNNNESDALKKLAQTSYIMGGGAKPGAAALSLNGKDISIPNSGFAPTPTTDAEKTGATTLQSQLQARLSPGGSYTPTPLDSYAQPGKAEEISKWASLGSSGLGELGNIMSDGEGSGGLSGSLGKSVGGKLLSGLLGGGADKAEAAAAAARAGSGGSMVAGSGLPGSMMSNIMGKALPIAGAIPGIIGLGKNASVGSDVMSGASSGASIGALGGPIGMGIGAGIGALVGALRGAFSVTGKEQSGRDTQTAATNNLASMGTPAQQAEAKAAGWPDPKQALSLIVMRDKLAQSGLPPAQAESQAESIMHDMWDSEKSGPEAVQKAAARLTAMLGPGAGGSASRPGGLVTDAFSAGARG